MTKSRRNLAAVFSALAITAALGACSPADKTDTTAANATDASTTYQAAPAGETGSAEDNASGVAREMHNQMNEGQAMHDAMKDGSMPHDQMGPGGAHGPGMKGMGSKSASDAPPKDKADPMPMNDM
jgi:hypothetical protein